MRRALYSSMVIASCITGGLAAVLQHISESSSSTYDFIVIGGGTTGSVVANRLSENANLQVLVIEAGPTNEGVLNAMVPVFDIKLEKTVYDWNYTANLGTGTNNRTQDYTRGRILRGCSSHKSIRRHVLHPRHNTRGQFDPSVHGLDGMVFTSLPGNPQTIDDKVLEIPTQLPAQFPFLLDMNAGRPLGLGWFQGSIGTGTRSSSATAYLSTKFTSRKNLHVLLNTKVLRIHSVAKGSTPIFNSIEINGTAIKITASKEIILSAGPINTPQILLNSGVGDQESLRTLGIPNILHIPSVGKNLTDHPFVAVSYSVVSNNPLDDINTNATLQALALAQWEFNRTGPYVNPAPNFIAWSRLPPDSPAIQRGGDPSAGPNTPHLEFIPFGPLTQASQPGHIGGIAMDVLTPSSRGSVTLNNTDPFGKPIIDLGLFTAEFDILAMVEAIRLGETFFKAPIWKDFIIEQLAPSPNATNAELVDFIRSTSFPTFHAVGTAVMSALDANYGVVNPDLRVKGASGLRVVDASVMPFINSGHPQAPVYAIAERASDLIKNSWK